MLSNIYLKRLFQLSSPYLKMTQPIVILDKADPHFIVKADFLKKISNYNFESDLENVNEVFKILNEPDSVGTICMLESHIFSF